MHSELASRRKGTDVPYSPVHGKQGYDLFKEANPEQKNAWLPASACGCHRRRIESDRFM